MSQESLRTSLYESHVVLGARMVPFAGYDMPVQYDSVIAESKAVREGAGMFDVSHMARLWLKGPRVLEYLEWITTNDVSALKDGHGQYSLLPNDKGGLVDDIIVYRVTETVFRMVVNASNHEKDVAWMKAHNDFGVEIVDETDATSMIAVQGPRAIEILAKLSDKPDELKKAAMFDLVDCTIAGVKCFAPRSGYTGEEGCELICANADAVKLWDALLAAGVKPCGLGARDVLRVEAGLPLYGHELGDDMSPLAVGLGWVIGKTKKFIGSEFINKARAEGTPRRVLGVKLHSKRLTMPGMKVVLDGKEIGVISSGIYSPTLDCGAAFAFVDSGVPLGTPVAVDIRGKLEPATLVGKRLLRK